MTGDFNLNLLNLNNDNNVKEFVDLFHSNNFFNVILKPTRVSRMAATLLDHVWTNDYSNCVLNNILYCNISDHFPTLCSFSSQLTKNKNVKKTIHFRNFNDINIANFKCDLQNVNWQLVYSATNPNISYDNFSLIFSSLFEKHFPVIEKVISPNNNNNNLPYIDGEIKSLIKQKNRLQRLASRWPLTYNNEFKIVRNQVSAKVRITKFKSRVKYGLTDSLY